MLHKNAVSFLQRFKQTMHRLTLFLMNKKKPLDIVSVEFFRWNNAFSILCFLSLDNMKNGSGRWYQIDFWSWISNRFACGFQINLVVDFNEKRINFFRLNTFFFCTKFDWLSNAPVWFASERLQLNSLCRFLVRLMRSFLFFLLLYYMS